ncbi:MAG: nickel ABC transporter substrate-binding protein [Firmicutes bacterium]|nr:nickel ABC transporter substrate-binding protein [Bacillota bacterium]
MKSIKYIIAVLVVAFAMVAFVGCGSSEEGDSGEHVFTVASSTDTGSELNPHLYHSGASLYALNLVYDPLVMYEDGEIVPALADEWNVSEDGLTYTFHIRDNAKFSDGTVCDANSIVKNFDAIMKNDKAVEDYAWMGVCANMDSYKAVDDSTFEFVLKQPYYPALQELASVRPWRMLGDAGFAEDGTSYSGITEPIGTGPFVLSDYKANEYAEFVRNEYYWGEAPKLDKFRVQIITDSETAVSAFESGQVDMLYDNYESSLMGIDTFNSLKDEGYESAVSGPVLTRVITLNSSQEPLGDFNVRKAIILGLDRETMVDSIFGGLEEMAQSYYAPSVMYCDVGLKGYEYNPEESARLLDEAGWKLEDGAEYRTKDGQELALDYYYDASHEVQTSFAQIFQADMKKIGIKVNITGEESEANSNRIYGGDFQVGYSVSWGDPQDPYSTLNAMSLEGYTDEQFALAPCEGYDDFAALVQSTFSETDPEVIQKNHETLLHYIEDQYCIIPISYQTNRAIAQQGVSGISFGYSNVMPMNTVTVGE